MTDELKKTQDPAADPAQDPAEREADDNITPENGDVISVQLPTDQLEQLIKVIAAPVAAVLDSDSFKNISKQLNTTLKAARSELEVIREIIQEAHTFYEEFFVLEPYLKKELQKPEYKGQTFDTVMQQYTGGELIDMVQDPGSFFEKAWEAARAAAIKDGIELPASSEADEVLPEVYYSKGTKIDVSTDKLPAQFFSVFAPPSKGILDGQIGMGVLPAPEEMTELKYEKNKAKKEISLYYDYSFDMDILRSIGLEGKFDAEDFFLLSVVDNLYMEGNKETSINKIFHELYGRDAVGTESEVLEKRLRRGLSTTIIINDKQVREAWKAGQANDKFVEIISPVMPVQLINERFRANGGISRNKVIINGLSPMYALSKSIKHVTTWDKEILTIYRGRRTPRYWRVLSYLMREIGWMRLNKSTRSNKITFEDLYKDTGAKTKRDRQATKTMFFKILDQVFIPLDYVKSYKDDGRGVPGVELTYTPKGKRRPRPAALKATTK